MGRKKIIKKRKVKNKIKKAKLIAKKPLLTNTVKIYSVKQL